MLQVEDIKINKRIQSLWAQKARVRWHLQGDSNSKFYHSMASAHFRNNYISCLRYNGEVYSDPAGVKLAARSYFETLFQEQVSAPFSFDEIHFSTLFELQASSLTLPFLEQEVVDALKSCDSTKAPGPEGFNFFFYKKAWEVMKPDILLVFTQFYTSRQLPKGLNSSFLALISKVAGSSSLSDFRPISLINGIYKLLSKVLSFRLRAVLPSLISDNQHAFIRGRSILECSMVASEVLHILEVRRESAFMLKLDFHKAFDSLSWNFLAATMKQMSFNQQWILWIHECLSTARISVLVNGSPLEPFHMRRGVRQDLSLLQFTDDTLIFISADLNQLQNLKRVLRCFELISGLKINSSKSSFVGLRVEKDFILTAADCMGCKIDTLPIKYLGLPLHDKSITVADQNPIVQKFENKLSLWKGKLLSTAGKLVLIKATLASIPIYFMSVFVLPQQVQKRLESHMSRFLWFGKESDRYLAKVSWNMICNPWDRGGLSIKPVKLHNQGLLLKWLRKLRSNREHALMMIWFGSVFSPTFIVKSIRDQLAFGRTFGDPNQDGPSLNVGYLKPLQWSSSSLGFIYMSEFRPKLFSCPET